jgi:hydroxymethylpyrimidine/phosphomethylpyrimidine kinase
VLDPVMVAKGGARLLADEAVAALRSRLLPLATLLTPNVPEAEALTGLVIEDLGTMRDACQALIGMGVPAVLLKGGHLAGGDGVTDILATRDGLVEMTSPRIETRHTHGTGCTLASAAATGLGQGMALEPAVRRARAYVLAAIGTAPGFGEGHGPLNHMVGQAAWSQPG